MPINSACPEMANSPDIFVARKILSSKYQPYVCGKIFRAPRSRPNFPISGQALLVFFGERPVSFLLFDKGLKIHGAVAVATDEFQNLEHLVGGNETGAAADSWSRCSKSLNRIASSSSTESITSPVIGMPWGTKAAMVG